MTDKRLSKKEALKLLLEGLRFEEIQMIKYTNELLPTIETLAKAINSSKKYDSPVDIKMIEKVLKQLLTESADHERIFLNMINKLKKGEYNGL